MKEIVDRDKDGKIVAYGLQIRDTKPHNTLSFVCESNPSHHLYMFVDEDGMPVGISQVGPSGFLGKK